MIYHICGGENPKKINTGQYLIPHSLIFNPQYLPWILGRGKRSEGFKKEISIK